MQMPSVGDIVVVSTEMYSGLFEGLCEVVSISGGDIMPGRYFSVEYRVVDGNDVLPSGWVFVGTGKEIIDTRAKTLES